MADPFRHQDNLKKFIVSTANSPASLLNEEQFSHFYQERILDWGSPDFQNDTWLTYQSTEASVLQEFNSTGMSAFDPKATLIPASEFKLPIPLYSKQPVPPPSSSHMDNNASLEGKRSFPKLTTLPLMTQKTTTLEISTPEQPTNKPCGPPSSSQINRTTR